MSCSNNNIEFTDLKNITVDTIPIQHLFSPTFMTTTKNTLTITSYGGTNKMLHFYKIPELKYMSSSGEKGRGPNEISLFPMICQSVSSDKLRIWGYTPLTIMEWNIDNDSLSLNRTHTLGKYENFNQLHIIQDSIFLYSAIPSEFSIKKYNLNSGKEMGEIALKIDAHNEPFYSSNYGFVAANDSFIVYAYNYKKQIDIYDVSTLQLKKRISGNYQYQTPIVGDNANNVQQYISVVAGEKYFYALYRGGASKNRTMNSDVIEVFDYDGKPVSKYIFDICPQIFTLDEANQMLYGFSYDFTDHLLKCHLDL